MLQIPKPTKPPKIERISIKNWLKGTVTAFDDGRTPTEGLRASGNVILDQDGTIRPRPSLVAYGTTPTGTILGEIYEFSKEVGTTNEYYLITMQNVAGTTKVYVSKDGGAWTVCNGKTYDNSAKAHFVQVDSKVLVMNGVDNLSYLDIPTLAVIPFTALGTQGITSAVATGVAGAGFTYYYRVSANSTVGETAASVVASVTTTQPRTKWAGGTTEYVTVTWPANPSATASTTYNVYLAETSTGTGYLIASGINGLTFKDDNTVDVIPNVSQSAPLGDTTAGPKVTRGSVINGQVFLTGDTDNIRYVRYGGNGTSVLDFSPFNGGGWVELGRGTKEIPVRVLPFRDGRGNSQITVLCQGTNGTGKRYLLTPNTSTLGNTIIAFFDVTEDNGQDGTDSPDGVILYRDSLWYPSKDGFKTTGTKPQLQNILSTDTVSETIINDVKNLNAANMGKVVGLAYQQRLYWALPNGSTDNNEIWVLDLARQGAWMKPWNIACDWMVLYNDNSGITHHLVLKDNVIYELTNSQATMDGSTAFNTNITSGLIKFSEDSLDWAKVIDVTFILLRPQGTINFTVSGQTEDDTNLSTVGSDSFTSNTSVVGWGEAGWGGSPDAVAPSLTYIYGWSLFGTVPTRFGDAQKLVVIEVDETLEWLTYELNTNQAGTDYQLGDVVVRYVNIGTLDITP